MKKHIVLLSSLVALSEFAGAVNPAPSKLQPAEASPLVQLRNPVDKMEMTDVATYFEWSPVKGCTTFDLQIARDAAFTNLFDERRIVNKGYYINRWFPKDPLPAGTYYWRVRPVMDGNEGAWSDAFTVSVNDQHPIKPELIRTISPETPLFLMRNRAWNPAKYSDNVREIIPAGLEHVIIADDIAMASGQCIERAQMYQELGVDFVIWDNRCRVPLSKIEYIFQNFSRCIGAAEGEHFSGMYWEKGPEGNLAELDFIHRAWMLCAKYGRFYFFSDGEAGTYRWPAFARREKEMLERYRRNIVLMFKTTNGDVALHSYGAVEGLMASGSVEQSGIWVDEWVWPCAGFGKLGEIIPREQIWANRRKVGTKQCPWIYDIQMWLMGIASGSTVFHLESAHQWTGQGQGAKQYERVFLPFVQAVVGHRLIPSRQAFLDSIKVAVASDPDLETGKHEKQYTDGFAYLKALYALKAPGDQELIPNDSRYGIVCLLPPETACLNNKTLIVPQAQFLDTAKAQEVFNNSYPQRFTGGAFMWECDGTVIVTNSNENEDVTQNFAMPLDKGPVRSLNGRIGVHQYLIGKIEKDAFWFQTNGEYPDRDIELSIGCTAKPSAKVSPSSAAKELAWDEAGKRLKLRLSVAEGAVEVEIK